MKKEEPPAGFLSHGFELIAALLERDTHRLQNAVAEVRNARHTAFKGKAVEEEQDWWNALLAIAQLSYESSSNYLAARKDHEALESDETAARILRAIHDGPFNQTALAGALAVDEGNLSRTLTKLEDRGLVRKRKESRSNRLFLTPTARDLIENHAMFCLRSADCPLQRASLPTNALNTAAGPATVANEGDDAPSALSPKPELIATMTDRLAEVHKELRRQFEKGIHLLSQLSHTDRVSKSLPSETHDKSPETSGTKEFFHFINDLNLNKLANLFLIRTEEPWLIAVVMGYLKPEHVRQVMAQLPPKLQAEVALEALQIRQITKEQLFAIETDIKENINFVVGGSERFIAMLDEADSVTRANILEFLRKEKPTVYDFVQKKGILSFEGIAHYSDRAMQAIVRELKTDQMATALQGAPPEIVNKFFSNMSAGAATLLKETLKYQKGLTMTQIDAARVRIIQDIKRMESQGSINIRPREAETDAFHPGIVTDLGLDSRQRRLAGSRASNLPSTHGKAGAMEDPRFAWRWYEMGVKLLNSGNPEHAVASLRKAVELAPELVEAHYSLGQALIQVERLPEAIACFENVLRLRPDPALQAWVKGVSATKVETGT